MIFFVVGSSGSGKTSCINILRSIVPNSLVYDFDTIGVPINPDKAWRQESTEKWLRNYLSTKHVNKNFILCGQMVLGEILACPSAGKLEKINLCLLDVADRERIKRLKERNSNCINQDILNWASWLRMHHSDPSWQQNVIKDNCWHKLNFSRWDSLTSWEDLAAVVTIDNTYLDISATAIALKNWIIDNMVVN
jgi:hypothetical protein